MAETNFIVQIFGFTCAIVIHFMIVVKYIFFAQIFVKVCEEHKKKHIFLQIVIYLIIRVQKEQVLVDIASIADLKIKPFI